MDNLMLSKQQLYSIASMLTISNLETTTSKIKQLNAPETEEAIKFATTINTYYKTRNGFIPKRVLKIIIYYHSMGNDQWIP